MRASKLAAAVVVGTLGLAGCGGSGGSAEGPDAAGTSAAAPAGPPVLTTAGSDLGEVLVDADGRTVYVFDEDIPDSGRSACSGDCAETWPAVTAESELPEMDGVPGEIDTFPRDDGPPQVTLNGRPLYLFAGDSGPGDLTGQGVDGVWWVVSADGTAITEVPDAPSGY